MFIEIKTFVVKKGYGHKLIEKFSNPIKIKEAEGFLELNVLKGIKETETEEILCMTKWESQEAFTAWKKSDAHKAGHKDKSASRPDFIVDVKMAVYTTV